MSRTRRTLPLVLFVAFIVMPLVEIYAVIQVGQLIGAWWTILILVVDSLIGAWLVRREGGRAWRALQEKFRGGGIPGRELADGALVLIGGTLLLTPGFVTDAIGFALVLAVTRPLFRRALTSYAAARVTVMTTGGAGAPYPGAAGPRTTRPTDRGDDSVVRGEVVDDDPE
ncbi:FxsA family protein [Nocardioides panacisoli]|uniref:FxsA family protein n=1 Tax=Nocardioides panacisoli TaxID=627624 RepID=UPI001C630DE2|nr:FxsA family protein [Nocardioides panacisoli]QYJ05068.1 FxsA family protein [Nocardioides panacisoli]